MKKQNHNKILGIILLILTIAIVIGINTNWRRDTANEKSKNDQSQKIENINIPLNIKDIRRVPLIVNNEFIGFVRIILLENGYEHITTPLIIQWLNEKSENITKEIILNKDSGFWSLGIESIEKYPNGILLRLSGTHTFSYEEKNFEIQIEKESIKGDLIDINEQ